MDRNLILLLFGALCLLSLSARRAWIEMLPLVLILPKIGLSLSARRAWIEMTLTVRNVPIDSVALRKESVDRNQLVLWVLRKVPMSLSARRAWIEMSF